MKKKLTSATKLVTKGTLHPRNPHQGRYDFTALSKACPELTSFIKPNPKGDSTIDFSHDKAVLCLNKALLAHYYHVTYWQIPDGYLCPPIPGRADYIHYVADLLSSTKHDTKTGSKAVSKAANKTKVLDIGTGANCIYPIIGSQSYDWQFVASDIDPVSVDNAKTMVNRNSCLKNNVTVVLQKDADSMFKGVIRPQDRFALTICNPPFHSSLEQAMAGSQRKWKNLGKHSSKSPQKHNSSVNKKTAPALNFGGQKAELWCEGGELAFLKRMAKESVEFAHQVTWFTSLISKSENVKPIEALLNRLGVEQVKVINMSQGQKVSRLIAWRFES